MDIINKFLLGLEQLNFSDLFLAFLSIFPWGFILYLLHPGKSARKLKIIVISLILGYISTRLILSLHPIIWPEIDFKPRKTSMLTATAHLAFIQAGMMEETFKILVIFLLALFLGYDYQKKIWNKDVVLIGGFVALGFAFTENYSYIHKEVRNTFQMFTGRLLYSSNIHLLINLCFTLFMLKANELTLNTEKIELYFKAFLLAVFQHGVVDFFLIPSSRFGIWLSVAMFIGIWVWVVRDLRTYVYYNITEITPVPKQLPLMNFSDEDISGSKLS